jgi:hypothetical protein
MKVLERRRKRAEGAGGRVMFCWILAQSLVLSPGRVYEARCRDSDRVVMVIDDLTALSSLFLKEKSWNQSPR